MASAAQIAADLAHAAAVFKQLDENVVHDALYRSTKRRCISKIGPKIQRLHEKAVSIARTMSDVHRTAESLCPHLVEAAAAKRERARQADASEPEAAAPTAFPQFASLPAELRLQIWEEAAQPPSCVEVVAIWEESAMQTDYNQQWFDYATRYAKATHARDTLTYTRAFLRPVPLLHAQALVAVCRDAHAAAMRVHAVRAHLPLFCPWVNTARLEEQNRRLKRVAAEVSEFYWQMRHLRLAVVQDVLDYELAMRERVRAALLEKSSPPTADAHAGLPAAEQQDAEQQTSGAHTPEALKAESIITIALRSLFPLEGHYPLASDEPIPASAVKQLQFNPRLRGAVVAGW